MLLRVVSVQIILDFYRVKLRLFVLRPFSAMLFPYIEIFLAGFLENFTLIILINRGGGQIEVGTACNTYRKMPTHLPTIFEILLHNY